MNRRYCILQYASHGSIVNYGGLFATPEEALDWYRKEGWKHNLDYDSWKPYLAELICSVNIASPAQPPVVTLEPLQLEAPKPASVQALPDPEPAYVDPPADVPF